MGGWVRSNVQWIGGYVERKVEMRWGIRPPSYCRCLHCLLDGRCEVACDVGQSIYVLFLASGSWVSGRCEIVVMCVDICTYIYIYNVSA